MTIGIYVENYIAGGVDAVIINKINSWPNDNDKIILFCNKNNDGLELIIRPRLKRNCTIVITNILSNEILYIYFKNQPHILIRTLSILTRHLFFFINYILIKKIFRKYFLDHIFIHNGGFPGALSAVIAISAARATGINSVNTIIHSLPAKYRFREFPFDLLYDYLLNKSSNIICVSNCSARILKKNRHIKLPITVIPNGIIPNIKTNKKHYIYKLDSINILIVGNFGKNKGHKQLIEAVRLIRDKEPKINLCVHIAGKGNISQTQNLINLLKSSNLTDYFIFHGFVEDITDLMTSMDVLAFPSIEIESFPMTILEAMSTGLPIVASDIGGVTEMLCDGKTGLVIESSNVEALAFALIRLIKYPELRFSLGQAAKEHFYNNFTAAKMALSYKNTIG